MRKLYPFSKEKAQQLYETHKDDNQLAEYLLHVLDDTLETYYCNSLQYFMGLSDFVAEGDFSNDYDTLIKLNIATVGSEDLLARGNSITGLRALLRTIAQEEILEEKYTEYIDAFHKRSKQYNVCKGAKGAYLTTKDEIHDMKEVMNTIYNALQEKASTKKVSHYGETSLF